MYAINRLNLLWLLLITSGLIRLISLDLYPLLDTTESRYGEIALIMAETGDWITPQIDYGIPFWGKPPLYAWASALSILNLGNTEFSLRLPHFLAALVVLLLMWKFVISLNYSRLVASYTIAVLATTFGFLLSAGIIMTDMLLCLSMTMSMIGFWRAWHGERVYHYLMFAGLGLGLLAKGPLVIVLVGLALFPWLVYSTGLKAMWLQIWLRLDVFKGILLMLLISAPWYIAAEVKTPGFLEYFLIGEHFLRFIDSGWEGDLYGAGHATMRGTIWIYWFIFSLPWSPFIVWWMSTGFMRSLKSKPAQAKLNIFLLLWMLSPLILFSFAGNILPAYVLPGLPALGLILSLNFRFLELKKAFALFLLSPVLMVSLLGFYVVAAEGRFSDKLLLQNGVNSEHPVFYFKYRPYSAQYYTNGKAKIVNALLKDKTYYLAVKKNMAINGIEKNCSLRSENTDRYLYFCAAPAS